MYAGGSGQQRYKTKRYKKWLSDCPKLEAVRISEAVSVEYIFCWPDSKKRDLSNYIKGIDDFLVNSGVLEDDNYNIISIVLIRHEGIKRGDPHVRVVIRRIEGDTHGR